MSAWIVSKTHIDLMVTAGLELADYNDRFSWWHEAGGKRYELRRDNRHEVGQMLWAENLASVAYRYPDDGDGERPGPNGFRDDDVLTYRHEEVPGAFDLRAFGVVAKAVSCYAYQSCEHPGWQGSQAWAFCYSLRDSIVTRLPGYVDAPWGFDDRDFLLNMRREEESK